MLCSTPLSAQPALPQRLAGYELDQDLGSFAANVAPIPESVTDAHSIELEGAGVMSLATNCRGLPSTRTIHANVRKSLTNHGLRIAYESIVPSKITLYTDASIKHNEASFYYYSANIYFCQGPYCSLSVTAVRVEAPVDQRERKILLSRARWWNDFISGDLIEAASPTALCSGHVR